YSLVSLPDNNLPEMSGSSKPSSSNGTLVDITSNLNSKWHEMLYDIARRNLQQVNIPKIDRFSIDHPTLLCKILEKIDDRYRLGCKFGIINVCYSSDELEALGTATYAELSKIPSN
ncbi:1914_t:CDS:2, partial [Gigaspora margarita]